MNRVITNTFSQNSLNVYYIDVNLFFCVEGQAPMDNKESDSVCVPC